MVLGLYLLQHFALLIPYGSELFSRDGLIGDPSLNFTFGILPNPLEHWDTPAFVTGFLVVMLLLSVLLTLGTWRRTTCVLLWYGWACLYNRNNLISNPSIPYVGLIFLFMVIIPPGEPLCLSRKPRNREWYLPWMVFVMAWLLMGIGYTFSGLDKLLTSPSWRDGTAMLHLVNNPLARPGPMRDLFFHLPTWIHQAMTWSALSLEVLFLPLCLTRRTRMVAWTLMVSMHLGILTVVDFADLTWGMMMFHLFTFDPAWLPPRPAKVGRNLVFFDGMCALCNGSMKFLIDEDPQRVLCYAPLQGETFTALRPATNIQEGVDSLVYARGHGTDHVEVFVRSDGILQILRDIGGFWRVVSWARAVPRPLRNRVYDFIARNRYQWFGRYDECRLPTPQQRAQLLS